MKNAYFEAIEKAQTLDELDAIIEQAADFIESNDDYIAIYEKAMEKAQMWAVI